MISRNKHKGMVLCMGNGYLWFISDETLSCIQLFSPSHYFFWKIKGYFILFLRVKHYNLLYYRDKLQVICTDNHKHINISFSLININIVAAKTTAWKCRPRTLK